MSLQDSHAAPGQAVGYVYQFDRATFILLSGEARILEVGIEDIDDVSVHYRDGSRVTEQDKSTIRHKNPLSDKSINLWNTLSIWVNDILLSPDQLSQTEYHLVTNGRVPDGALARLISDARDSDDAAQVAGVLRETAKGLTGKLGDLASCILQLSEDELAKFITRISLFDETSARFGGNLDDLASLRYFSHHVKVSIYDQACGWVKRRIRELLEAGERPRIRATDFTREVTALINRVQASRLSAVIRPPATEVDWTKYEMCGFVQQLGWVECDRDTMIDAIIHFIQAEETRLAWADDGLVSEQVLAEYERDLINKWKLHSKTGKLQVWPSPEIQGKALLFKTLSSETHIHCECMPTEITSGNFHLLADFQGRNWPRIGWHPGFESLAVQESEPSHE